MANTEVSQGIWERANELVANSTWDDWPEEYGQAALEQALQQFQTAFDGLETNVVSDEVSLDCEKLPCMVRIAYEFDAEVGTNEYGEPIHESVTLTKASLANLTGIEKPSWGENWRSDGLGVVLHLSYVYLPDDLGLQGKSMVHQLYWDGLVARHQALGWEP